MNVSDQPARVARWLAGATLASGVALAACGGTTPSVPTAKGTRPSRSSTPSASQPRPKAKIKSRTTTAGGGLASQELAYAKCMRANGVPGFPDPNPGGGFAIRVGSGVDPASAQYQSANAKCGKLLPGGGVGPTVNPREGAALVKIATCMRAHGIAGFPDPVRATSGSLPRPKPGYSRITNFQGWLLEFPATIDMQSPAYVRAAAACGAGFLNRPQ